MTDDELRKLAEAVVALPEPNPEQHALVGVIGTMRELARAVLRLLKERARREEDDRQAGMDEDLAERG